MDADPGVKDMFNIFVKDINWAKNITTDLVNLHGFDNKVSEIWLQNFKGMEDLNKNKSNLQILQKISSLLEKGGKLLFLNTYDNYSDEKLKLIIESLEKTGFKVEEIKDLNDKNNHPFISYYVDLQKDVPESLKKVGLVASKA